jgi:hypothetical protein
MKIGDLVMLSKKARGQNQNRHIASNDVGLIFEETDSDLFFVKWFSRTNKTLHYRYELKRAK